MPVAHKGEWRPNGGEQAKQQKPSQRIPKNNIEVLYLIFIFIFIYIYIILNSVKFIPKKFARTPENGNSQKEVLKGGV